ncbi:hypothetical protein [Staphylococcus phage PT1-4]
MYVICIIVKKLNMYKKRYCHDGVNRPYFPL